MECPLRAGNAGARVQGARIQGASVQGTRVQDTPLARDLLPRRQGLKQWS
jgi:hypothetical protein